MLQLVDIHTYYGDSHILHGVSLEVKEGSVVALLGRNGMGKTTTIHTIIGFTPPRQGTLHFKGTNITGFPPYQIARMGVGLVPQGRRIFRSLTVKENLTIAAHPRDKQGWDLDKVFALFPRLKERINARGNCLSGGELQMLAIARALMSNPRLILMDEPSEGLAPILVKEIGRTVQQLKQEKEFSILLVEQNFRLAMEVADYVYIMSKGRIVYESTPQALKDNGKVKAEYLGV